MLFIMKHAFYLRCVLNRAGLAISGGQLNFCWPSPAQSFLVSRLVEIYDQVFCSLLNMYVFARGASPSMKGGVDLSV
jgi:hypothetical protein